MTINALYRYPIKGLGPEPLQAMHAKAHSMIAYDRTWAITCGTVNLTEEEWLPKKNFYQLVNYPMLALLAVSVNDDGIFTIMRNGKRVSAGNPNETTGRMLLETFLRDYIRDSSLHLYHANKGLSDERESFVSIINTQTMADINRTINTNSYANPQKRIIDVASMRGNIIIDGALPWQERDWIGQYMRIGTMVIKIERNIDRCMATNTNYNIGKHDCNIPNHLRHTYGHIDCGVFGTVIEDGVIHKGDEYSIMS